MLTDVMDFDPRITSDGCGYGAAYGVHCNFHCGYLHDVFVEDAKSEEACVQTLQHLIAEEEADIEFLEVELALLQCEIKWSEIGDQIDSCEVDCAALQQRINSLSSFIRKESSNRNALNGRDIYNSWEIQMPADRIYIDDPENTEFTEHDEQVGDFFNENNLFACSGLLEIDMDLRQQETMSESILESTEESAVLRKLDKNEQPSPTVSEESNSDPTKYATRNLAEVKEIVASHVEVTEKLEVDIRCISEDKSGYVTSNDIFSPRSPLQVSHDEGNSEGIALQHGERDNCMAESKTGSNISPLAAYTEVIVKVEQYDYDVPVDRVHAGSFPKAPDNNDVKETVVGQLRALENQSDSVSELDITYARRKSSLGSVLKPNGHKVQRKFFDGSKQATPSLTLKPQKKIAKKLNSSIEEKLGQSGSAASNTQGRRQCLPDKERHREPGTEDDIACGYPEAKTKGSEKNRASRERYSNQSPKVRIPKRLPGPMGVLALPSPDGTNSRILCSEPIEVRTEWYSNHSPKVKMFKRPLSPKEVFASPSSDGTNPLVLEANVPEPIGAGTESSSIQCPEMKISGGVLCVKGVSALPSPDGITPPMLGTKGSDPIGAGTESCTIPSLEAKLSEGIVDPKEVFTSPSLNGINPLVSGAKGLEPKVNSIGNPSIQFPEVKISKRHLITKGGLSVKSSDATIQGLKPLNSPEVQGSENAIIPDKVASRSTSAKKVKRQAMPIIDLGELKQKIAEEPKLLFTMTVTELRAILAHCKYTGVSKFTKAKLIDLLTNHIATV